MPTYRGNRGNLLQHWVLVELLAGIRTDGLGVGVMGGVPLGAGIGAGIGFGISLARRPTIYLAPDRMDAR